MADGVSKSTKEKGKRGRDRKIHCQGAENKDPDDVPILQYGPSNNFMKFKEALSKKLYKNVESWGSLSWKEL
jgi:hypothetical protein